MIQANPLGILLAITFTSSMVLLFFWMFHVPPAVPLPVARVHRSVEAVRKVLVPIVETFPSERAVELACRLGNGKKVEIVLVHVIVVPYTLALSTPMPELEKTAQEALDLGRAIGQRYDCQIRSRLIRHRDAAEGILAVAREENVDAIVLGVGLKTRVPGELGRTGLEILRRAECEVIVDKVPLATQPMVLRAQATRTPVPSAAKPPSSSAGTDDGESTTSKYPRPRWWLLYLLLPLMIGLLYLESRALWTTGQHQAAQISITLITYGLMWLWLKANEGALIWEEVEKTRWSLDADRNSQPERKRSAAAPLPVIWTFLKEETNDGNADQPRACDLEPADPQARPALPAGDHRDRSVNLPLASSGLDPHI